MSDQQNVELIKSGYAAFTRGDRQTFLDFFSEDVDFQHPMSQAIRPWAGKRNSGAGLAEFLVGINECAYRKPRSGRNSGAGLLLSCLALLPPCVYSGKSLQRIMLNLVRCVLSCVQARYAPSLAPCRRR
jgi:hypothetical protein